MAFSYLEAPGEGKPSAFFVVEDVDMTVDRSTLDKGSAFVAGWERKHGRLGNGVGWIEIKRFAGILGRTPGGHFDVLPSPDLFHFRGQLRRWGGARGRQEAEEYRGDSDRLVMEEGEAKVELVG